MSKAILYNREQPVLYCELEKDKVIGLGEIVNENALPLKLKTLFENNQLGKEEINQWIARRLIPTNRDGLDLARKEFGSKNYSNYGHMFSLTDQYWFQFKKTEKWRDLNFFSNPYSSVIGDSIFAPWQTYQFDDVKGGSPDLTTNGVCKKVWVQNERTLDSYLIKSGSKKFMQEPISEILASLTLARIHLLPFVRYELCIHHMQLCSKCRNFVTRDTEFVPAQSIYNLEPRLKTTSRYDHLIAMCKKYGLEDPADFIDRMILCDVIIGNSDRHLGNFGALHDVVRDKVIGFAPLFDFGSAFHEFRQMSVKKKDNNQWNFDDQVSRVVAKYACERSLSNLLRFDDLLKTVDTYPDLSTTQKNAIKSGIQERFVKYGSLGSEAHIAKAMPTTVDLDMDMLL